MFRPAGLKGASLVAVMVTAIVFPLAMFIAYAPGRDDAAGGFNQANLTATNATIWIEIALAIFITAFAVATVVLLPRGRSRPRRLQLPKPVKPANSQFT
jgi:hypothetical protein